MKNSEIKTAIKKFLKEQRFLPLSPKNKEWTSCTVSHKKTKPSDDEDKKFLHVIKSTSKQSGVYI